MWWRNYSQTFYEKSKLSISLDQKSKFLFKFVFTVCQIEGYQNILKLSCRLLAFSSSKTFSKNKERSGTSIPISFLALLLKKIVSLVIFYKLLKFIIAQFVYYKCLLTRFVNQVFKLTLSF